VAMTAPTPPAPRARSVTVGERIRMYRTRRGWSQEKLANAVATEVAMSVRHLRRIEVGEIDNPGIKTLGVIARKLDISPVALAFGEDGEHTM